MDDQRFDQLSRRMATFKTRRQAIRALAGAVIGAVAAGNSAAAQTCVPQYSPCTADTDCCAGAVCEYGMCMPGCRVDGAFHHAWTSPPENICGQCQPEVSTASLVPVNEGMACWSGDPNAGFTTCQSGACATTCRSDTDCVAGAHCDDGQCVPDADLGQPCDEDSDCTSGICSDGVCCNERCDGLCQTCAGASPGFCAPVICDDGLGCTVSACDPKTGQCVHPLNNGACLIDGVCHGEGTINNDDVNACEICQSRIDPFDWTTFVCTGDACNDPVCTTTGCSTVPAREEQPCGVSGICRNGLCEAGE